jgi:hypothetical protein
MNLQSWHNRVAETELSGTAVSGFFRQIRRDGLSCARRMKLSSVRPWSVAVALVWAVVFTATFSLYAQTNFYSPNGSEYPVVGLLHGDQVFPDVAISTTNGYVVWQDNATDGDGWGISARRLDGTLSGTLGTFRVNSIGTGNQKNPRVGLLKKGGAAFVWQGGKPAAQHIYARFLSASNTFMSTSDILISTATNTFQLNPAVAVLTNGNVVVVWASYNQAGSNSMQDIYCQMLATNGTKIGTNFLVNQYINFNQRTPVVAALNNGGFLVGWVSEQERSLAPSLGSNTTLTTSAAIQTPSVDVYARFFNANGKPATSEFIINTGSSPCADPSLAVASDGTFMLAWGQKDRANPTNGWDIVARTFSSTGQGGTVFPVNTYTHGDQYLPHIKSIGTDYMILWTSLAQDGSREGVYGQFVHSDGTLIGGEIRVNTTTMGPQMQPALASDGVGQFLAVWTSFTGLASSMDLFAQRFLNAASVLQPMSAPFVRAPFTLSKAVYQPQLAVSWAPQLGLSVANYEIYVDASNAPAAVVASNYWTMTAAQGLKTNSTHSFAVDYITTDGRRSPLSPPAKGATWSGENYDGTPVEWMRAYYGTNVSKWPVNTSKALSDGGLSLNQVFVSGGSPLDPSTWLHEQTVRTAQGMFLTWNTQPGSTYQVMVSTNFTTWTSLGAPRFAAGGSDSVFIGGGSPSYYRVMLLR